MLKVALRGLLSPMWICVLSCALVSPALGQTEVRCGRNKTRNPQICKGLKRDARGCCAVSKRKTYRKIKRKKRKSASANSNRLLGWGLFKEFKGVGLKSDYYYNSQGADGSLGIAARAGSLGIIGFGWVGSVNYRFNSHLISGHAGCDAYLALFGLQLALAWQVDRQQNQADFGINYGLKLFLPASYPMFVTIGGQSYTEAPTEFLISFSVFTSLDDRPLKQKRSTR